MLPYNHKINKYISLELRNESTFVYVNNVEVSVCKHIAVDLPIRDLKELEDINSVDELSERYKRTRKDDYEIMQMISSEEEFFVHCSNIQAWAESGYDTQLLHTNIAFPLLMELSKVGDLQAKSVFKEEIVKRYRSGNKEIQQYLIKRGFLSLLTNAERELLFKSDLECIKQIEKVINGRLILKKLKEKQILSYEGVISGYSAEI
ncbi:MAG: hypothetical protein ACTSV5_11445 [Promethearchaeota archaeon]